MQRNPTRPRRNIFSVEDKNIFITGGASGIGLAVAEHFAAQGARVAIADIQDGTEVAQKIGAVFISTDVADAASVASALARAAEELGKLDVVINNAGVVEDGYTFIEEKDPDDLKRVMGVNCNGVYYGMKYAPRHMNDGGAIINTSSLAAMLSIPYYSVYSASKAAVVSMTKSAAIELGKRGIRVNAVCPGTIHTPMQPDDDVEAVMCRRTTPLERLGSTDDLVGLYQFLASEAASYITGEAIVADGGWGAGLAVGALEALTK